MSFGANAEVVDRKISLFVCFSDLIFKVNGSNYEKIVIFFYFNIF